MRYSKGYSLIELAIVLMVIGVMIGGALKARGLIVQARSQALLTQVQQVRAAWFNFKDRFGGVPGDLINANSLINGSLNGDGDGVIDSLSEAGQAWFQLSYAGLISGRFDGDSLSTSGGLDCKASSCPNNPFGGYLRLEDFKNDQSTWLSLGLQIPAEAMARLDQILDDGLADQGDAQLIKAGGEGCGSALWDNDQSCTLAIRL